MAKYVSRIVAMTVVPQGEELFSECATRIEIVDEAAGEFIKVTQEDGHTDLGKSLAFNPEEWPTIREAIETMIFEIKKHEKGQQNDTESTAERC